MVGLGWITKSSLITIKILTVVANNNKLFHHVDTDHSSKVIVCAVLWSGECMSWMHERVWKASDHLSNHEKNWY